MSELHLAAYAALLVKLLVDVGAGSFKITEFNFPKWINENLLRVLLAVIAIFIYVKWMAAGETPKTIITEVIVGDWFFYGVAKKTGLKGVLPRIMKRSKS